MPSFLLELCSEEIPARMQETAALSLQSAFADALQAADMAHGEIRTFVTPRRLALYCAELPPVQPDKEIEEKGPKTIAPPAALEGFLRSRGLTADQLERRMVGKDETYFARRRRKGLPAKELLEDILHRILADFPWPKSMRWGSGETRWVRPLHSILCLLDGEVIPVAFAGLTAGNITYGHRFMAPAALTIAKPEDYEEALHQAYVIADAKSRKAEILNQIRKLAAGQNLELKDDLGLLTEVTGLVEWPVVLMGRIDPHYMDLPPEVLISEMRAHQKYFALQDNGVFSDRFIITANTETEDGGKAVIAGNERVLRARLSDGRFFWDQDRKKPLSEWARGLEGVTFHAKIGTVAQKVERIAKLAVAIADYVPGADKSRVERAALLCKADLVTGMVGEFPELQGVMGRYYAIAQKEDASVADAIRDHYLPLGPDSPVPTWPVSICVALADKLDTLVSMWAAGEKPTGSKDPFALRRSALGVISIILENKLRFPLKAFLSEELVAFFSERLVVKLKNASIRHDLISAVMANGDDDLVRVVARAEALGDFLATDDGSNLLAAYRRAGNIVSIEEKKDKQSYQGDVALDALAQPEEQALFALLERIGPEVGAKLAQEDFTGAMGLLASLRATLDAFFDKVMVNVPDRALRANRLGLLARIRATLDDIVDFSLIEG